MTMDAIVALNFGIVISIALKEMGITEEKELVSNTIKFYIGQRYLNMY